MTLLRENMFFIILSTFSTELETLAAKSLCSPLTLTEPNEKSDKDGCSLSQKNNYL